MKKKLFVYATVLLIILCLSSLSSSGFVVNSPFTGGYTHEWITRRALERMGGFGYDGPVNPSTTHWIVGGSGVPDGSPPPIGRWPDWAHYKLESGVQAIWYDARGQRLWRRQEAVNNLPDWWWQDPHDLLPPTFLSTVGNLFHPAQDFYAHTNWVYYHPDEVADLEQREPPEFLNTGGPGDSGDSPFGYKAVELAILATIKDWYQWEHDLYARYSDTATIYLNEYLDISSQAQMYSPRRPPSERDMNYHEPKEGYVQTTQHKVIWYQTAIPHTTPIKIELLKDGVYVGDIFKPLPIDANEYTWDFYNYTDPYGSAAVTDADNGFPRYKIRISTLDGLVISPPTDWFYIQQPVPNAPSDLTARPIAYGNILLEWKDNSNCETGFDILRKTEGDSDYTVLGTIGPRSGSGCIWNDTTVSPGVLYIYLIRAKFPYEDVSYSNIAEGIASLEYPPDAPYTISATYDRTRLRIVVSWSSDSINVQEFDIERRYDLGTEFTTIAHLSYAARTYADTRIPSNRTYEYRVKAHNPYGFSYSDSVSVYTGEIY